MKRTAFILAVGVSSFVAMQSAQAAVSLSGVYTFTGADPAGDLAVPTQANVTYGQFSRVNLTQNSVADVFSSGGWSQLTTSDTSQYVQFTLTPASGYSFDLTSFTFTNVRGPNGPASALVEMSWGAQTLTYSYTPSKNTPQTLTWDFADFNASSEVTIKFFGWNSKVNNGNDTALSFDDVAFNGSVVPEPVNVALGILGGAFVIVTVARSRLVRDRVQRFGAAAAQWVDAV
jgi:hypothetical protein